VTRDEKAALRAHMKALRAAIPAETAHRSAHRIVDPVLAALDGIDTVLVYIGVRDELDTGALLDALWRTGRTVAVPRITGPTEMVAAHLPHHDALQPGRFGVPTSDGPVCTSVGAVVVPGLAFDRSGGRLGYGAGFYDRWLADHPVRSIGIGFDVQLVERVPMEPHDRRLDVVITPSAA
jgi:5-formyltetrahydrofolate cyclo-ligase